MTLKDVVKKLEHGTEFMIYDSKLECVVFDDVWRGFTESNRHDGRWDREVININTGCNEYLEFVV